MLSFEELNLQNHKISELSQVSLHLIKNREMCDMDTTCDIFMMFLDSVNEHLKTLDTKVYGTLLGSNDVHTVKVAEQFMSGSAEIKKIFQKYINRWCDNKKLRIKNHDDFVEDSEQMMKLVSNRIQDETEKLYPVVRGTGQAA